MIDFRKWDRFDPDAADAEMEQKAQLEQVTRARVTEEQSVLKDCDARAAALKSEAAVRALKAKRSSRNSRRHKQSSSGSQSGLPTIRYDSERCRPTSQQHPLQDPVLHSRKHHDVVAVVPNTPFLGTSDHATNDQVFLATAKVGGDADHGDDDPLALAAQAKRNAERAGELARGLRRGLTLRDEVVALAESGELHRGVKKARECLRELDIAQQNILHSTKLASTYAPGGNISSTAGTVANHCSGSSCCGGSGESIANKSGHGHDHTHAHDHHRNHNSYACDDKRLHQEESSSLPASANEAGRTRPKNKVIDKPQTASESQKLPKCYDEAGGTWTITGAVEVLRRAKAMCRVAEGTCFLQGGRAAQATETLRDLLLEDPESVPAWVARGEGFVAMGIPLLAGLHFDRALMLDPACADAAVHKDNLRRISKEQSSSTEKCDRESANRSGAGVRNASDSDSASVVFLSKISLHPLQKEGSTIEVDSRQSCLAKESYDANAVGSGPGSRKQVRAATVQSANEGVQGMRTSKESDPAPENISSRHEEAKARLFTDSAKPLLAEACKSYREGVVLHQEQFLMSSTGKFGHVLSCLDRLKVILASPGTSAVLLAAEAAEGVQDETDIPASSEGVGDGSGVSEDAALTKLRIGCHLNIAAAVLLRQREYESAVHHCTRALVSEPGNCQALVRRAQAHEALGLFRLAVEDLEAAEASLTQGMRTNHPRDSSWASLGSRAWYGEVKEVRRRLEHARWTKIHVGNGRDELHKAIVSVNERGSYGEPAIEKAQLKWDGGLMSDAVDRRSVAF